MSHCGPLNEVLETDKDFIGWLVAMLVDCYVNELLVVMLVDCWSFSLYVAGRYVCGVLGVCYRK